MISELRTTQTCVKIHFDSQIVIRMTNHRVYHESTKQIDIHFYFIWEMIESKEIEVEKVAS